jgi:hypothetical protein
MQNKRILILISAILFPVCVIAAENNFNSQFINQSNQSGSKGFNLVKTRVWPESGCVIDSGKDVVKPGESTKLEVMNKKECDQAGIGYSMYKAEDTKNAHLLGYVSHRFRDGKFSLQISVFCEGDKCIFRDYNPQQNR